MIGVVTDNKDPDKLGRVKVKYPLLNDEVESGWARIAWGAAGKERGTVAIPHVNDELAIGFEHGDVRRPIILGALFNGVDKPGADLVKDTSSVAARFPRDLDIATKKKTLLTGTEDITVKSETGAVRARGQQGRQAHVEDRHDHDRGERRPDQGDRQGGRRDQRQRPDQDHLDGARSRSSPTPRCSSRARSSRCRPPASCSSPARR